MRPKLETLAGPSSPPNPAQGQARTHIFVHPEEGAFESAQRDYSNFVRSIRRAGSKENIGCVEVRVLRGHWGGSGGRRGKEKLALMRPEASLNLHLIRTLTGPSRGDSQDRTSVCKCNVKNACATRTGAGLRSAAAIGLQSSTSKKQRTHAHGLPERRCCSELSAILTSGVEHCTVCAHPPRETARLLPNVRPSGCVTSDLSAAF